MKKILIFLGLVVSILGYSQKVGKLPYDTVMQVYKGDTLLTLFNVDTVKLVSTLPNLSFNGYPITGLSAIDDGILDWQTNKYMPYYTATPDKGAIYRYIGLPAILPTSNDTFTAINGVWCASSMYSGTYTAYSATDNGYLSTNDLSITKGTTKGVRLSPSIGDNNYIFNTYSNSAATDTIFRIKDFDSDRFRMLGDGIAQFTGIISQGGVAADSGINGTSLHITGGAKINGIIKTDSVYGISRSQHDGIDNIINPPHYVTAGVDSSVTIDITVAGTFVKITNSTQNLFAAVENSGDVFTFNEDAIAINTKGHYKIAIGSITIEGANNDNYGIIVNSTNGILAIKRASTPFNGAYVTFDIDCYLGTNLNPGDEIWFEITDYTATNGDPIIKDFEIAIEYFHPVY